MATKPKKEVAASFTAILLSIAVSDIIPSPTNPRREFKAAELQELAESIKKVGVLQPIVVMKDPEKSKFELICGERRFRAAQIAMVENINAMVYDPLPQQVILEMQITENLQRKNINVMEESNAFHVLIKSGAYNHKELAERLSVSERYVYDRLLLQNLIEPVQEMILNGRFSFGHGKEFARLGREDQAKVFEKLMENMDDDEQILRDEIKTEINRMFKNNLANAPFDIGDKNLVKKAGACAKCDKRTGCRLVLFDDVEPEDICLDSDCYDSKINAHIEKVITEQKELGKEVVLISAQYHTKKPGVIGREDWGHETMDDGKDSSVVGILVEEAQWSQSDYKLAQVVQLEPDFNKEEQDDESDSDGKSKPNRSKTEDPKEKDVEEIFIEELSVLTARHFANMNWVFTQDNLDVIDRFFKEKCERLIYRFNEETEDRIYNLLHPENPISLVDEDLRGDVIKKALQTWLDNAIIKVGGANTLFFLEAFENVDDIGGWIEQEEIEEANKLVKAFDIDLFEIAHRIEAENDGKEVYSRRDPSETNDEN